MKALSYADLIKIQGGMEPLVGNGKQINIIRSNECTCFNFMVKHLNIFV